MQSSRQTGSSEGAKRSQEEHNCSLNRSVRLQRNKMHKIGCAASCSCNSCSAQAGVIHTM